MRKKLYSNNGKFQNHSKFIPMRKQKLRCIRTVLSVVCTMVLLAVIGVSVFLLHNRNAEAELQKLSAQVQLSTEAVGTTEAAAATEPSVSTDPSVTTEPTAATVPVETKPEMLSQYKDLYATNNEMVGWIKIDDTKIDYPVMHTPDDPQKYLHMSFSQTNSYPGVPFIDAGCTMESQNLLIYAHNMPNGTMFRDLLKYQQKNFWQQHPTIIFNTLYEEQEYEIIAAFYDRVYYTRETGMFKFYQFIDPETEDAFNNGITVMKEKSLYDTGVTAQYGDRLITLVTCAYHTDHGRFVVVARKK